MSLYERPMSYGEAEETISKHTKLCQKRDGECSIKCPLSQVRELMCPFEDIDLARKFLMSEIPASCIKNSTAHIRS